MTTTCRCSSRAECAWCPQPDLLCPAHPVLRILQASFEWARAYVKERQAFGGSLLKNFQTIRHKLAEIKTETAVARAFYDNCLELHSQGRLDSAQGEDRHSRIPHRHSARVRHSSPPRCVAIAVSVAAFSMRVGRRCRRCALFPGRPRVGPASSLAFAPSFGFLVLARSASMAKYYCTDLQSKVASECAATSTSCPPFSLGPPCVPCCPAYAARMRARSCSFSVPMNFGMLIERCTPI